MIYKLTFSSGRTVETTWNHPFWVSSTGTSTDSTGSPTTGSVSDISSLQAGKWIEAKDLQIGDESILQDGRLTQIQSIEQVRAAPTKVYNIEVEDFHTYFVGEDGVWVHNYPGEKIVNAAKNFISEKVEEAKDWVAGQKNYGKSIDYNDGKTDWRDSLEDIEKPRFARHDSDKEHTYRAVTLEQDGKKVSIIVRSSADIENLNEKSVKAFAKTAFETKGLNSVMINSGYRTGKDAGVHDQASYLDIRYLNHTRLNNGSNGNPGNQNIAQPEIYGNFKEAHSNNSSKQFLGPWSQSSKGRDWNWGDKPKAKTDAKHWHHGHIGY